MRRFTSRAPNQVNGTTGPVGPLCHPPRTGRQAPGYATAHSSRPLRCLLLVPAVKTHPADGREFAGDRDARDASARALADPGVEGAERLIMADHVNRGLRQDPS